MRTLTLLTLIASLFLADVASAQVRPGSIYDVQRGPAGLIANKTARRPGDLITVLISETQDVTNEEVTGLQKQTSLDYELVDFNLFPNAFSTLPSLDGDSSKQFQGNATQSKRGTFTARLTAMVVDVLPNGNLVISGRREVRVDNDVKLIEFSGVVRKYDVSAANTVASELVADATVSYTGTGPIANTGRRRGFGAWLSDALDWLWPF
ncbi:MAG: flagellar basal body L-ring protein FlgH [Planctomycetota bacterium]|jgi:flagellar L-ring protein precursor FlgH